MFSYVHVYCTCELARLGTCYQVHGPTSPVSLQHSTPTQYMYTGVKVLLHIMLGLYYSETCAVQFAHNHLTQSPYIPNKQSVSMSKFWTYTRMLLKVFRSTNTGLVQLVKGQKNKQHCEYRCLGEAGHGRVVHMCLGEAWQWQSGRILYTECHCKQRKW